MGKAHEGAVYSINITGGNLKRISPIIIVMLMLTSCAPIGLVMVSGASSNIESFSGGYATIDVDLQGGLTNNSTSFDVSRNVTILSSGFEVSVTSSAQSPGKVWIDIGEDGTFEWEYTGTGYGDIGHQNEFYDGSNWSVSQVSAGNSSSPGILVPSLASFQSSNLEVEFSPSAGGGFFAIGEHQQTIHTDIDGDGDPEPMFLTNIQTNNTTSILWADWNSNSGITMSNPIQTCDNATSISVGDINGDGHDDIVAFSVISSSACIHFANGTTYDPVMNLTITQNLIGAEIADFNLDGHDDIISINSGAVLSYQSWNNTTSSLSVLGSEVVNENGTASPAILQSLHVGDFFASGNNSILVKDDLGHWTLWSYISGFLGGPIIHFDDILGDEILTDLDGDGDIDVIGTTSQGYAFRINDGTKWNLNSTQGQINILNSTITDYDNDGDLDLMTPWPGVSDGSSATIEGNISIREINSSSIGSPSTLVLEPWSIPTSITTMDMDGDGILEHIVSAGENSKGVFIGGWHSIELDANRDGIPELSMDGYAGDSSSGLEPLMMSDDTNAIMGKLSEIATSQQSIIDNYGISMTNFSMNVKTTGNGEFNYSELDIGYDCTFLVNQNPHVIGNLTNSLNQQMTGGVGNFSINIPINSTKLGTISLTNFFATTIPGAPNFSNPPAPVISMDSVSQELIELSWNESSDYGSDFIEFELFRLESANQTADLTNPYYNGSENELKDTNITVGSTYWYIVRSTHQFGIASNFSQPLQITVPYPQPPSALTVFALNDVPSDQGGTLQLTWNHSYELITGYEIYLENSSFSNLAGLTPFNNVSYEINSTTISGLVDGQGYWATVVPVDEFGNKTENVLSVGPAYPRNDDPNSVNLQISVSSEISLGLPFNLEVTAEVGGESVAPSGNISITMVTNTGAYPISTNWDAISLSDFSELVSSASDISGNVTFWANYSGDEGDEITRPLAATSTSVSSFVTVQASLSSLEDVYELDWENETIVRINLTALNPVQQSLLEGSTFSWTAYNNTTGSEVSGSEVIQNGFQQFIVTFDEPGTLFINLTGPDWVDVGDEFLQITLVAYGETIDDNITDDNDTVVTPWSPDIMLDVTLDCGNVIIDPSQDQELDCTISNPNNYSVDISLEADGWSEWSDYILFEPTAGQSDFTLEASESKNLEIRVDIVQDLSESGLITGLMQVDLRQGPTNYTNPGDRPQTFEISWNLVEEEPIDVPDNNENNTNQTTTTNEDTSSDNTMLIVGGVGGVALLGLVIFIVLRIKNSDVEDWDEDDLDMEPEVEEPSRISKPLPVGVGLDEFDDKTIVDDSPDRPDFINEFDDSEDYSQESEQDYEYEEQSSDEEYSDYEQPEEDSGITVDEHGTEWYEDEVGVWWFRDPGEDDWSEFTED